MEIANKAAEVAIKSGLNFSFRSLAGKPLQDRRRMHKSLAVLAGEAASYLSDRGVVNEFAPALVRLVAQIGNHFGVVVSQKLVAQSVPLIGAAGDAAINYAFADHFQRSRAAISRSYGWNASMEWAWFFEGLE